MNIYEKLTQARYDLYQTDIKKSGLNPFAKFPYYTLKDFIPFVVAVEKKLGFVSVFNHGVDVTSLTLYNTEKPEEMIVFETQTKTSNLKNAHDVQNLGAEHTYMKRYLYMNAFEITEGDALDETVGDPSMNVEPKQDTPKQEQPKQNDEAIQMAAIRNQAILDKNKLGPQFLIECGGNEKLASKVTANTLKHFEIADWKALNLVEIPKAAFKEKFMEELQLAQDLEKAGL